MSKLYGTTVAEIINTMPERFKPDESGDEDFIIGYECLGEGGGSWKVVVAKGAVTVEPVEGGLDGCTTTIHASDAETFIGVIVGKVDPLDAQNAGTLRIEGDVDILTKRLPKIFSRYSIAGTDAGVPEMALKQPQELSTLSVINSIDQRYATGPMMAKSINSSFRFSGIIWYLIWKLSS